MAEAARAGTRGEYPKASRASTASTWKAIGDRSRSARPPNSGSRFHRRRGPDGQGGSTRPTGGTEAAGDRPGRARAVADGLRRLRANGQMRNSSLIRNSCPPRESKRVEATNRPRPSPIGWEREARPRRLRKPIAPDHPDVATSLENLAALYSATNRMKEAEVFEKRAAAIRAIKR